MERMHINEAVRVYNKTRQTFYNWIKRGYLKSKKINGKVYVWVADAEQLVNDYIAPDGYHVHKHAHETAMETNNTLMGELIEHDEEIEESHDMIEELVNELSLTKYELQNKIDTQKQTISNEITLTKQELRTDIQRAAEGMQQTMAISTDTLQNTYKAHMWSLTERLEKIKTQTKINTFWVGYFVFAIVNLIIIALI